MTELRERTCCGLSKHTRQSRFKAGDEVSGERIWAKPDWPLAMTVVHCRTGRRPSQLQRSCAGLRYRAWQAVTKGRSCVATTASLSTSRMRGTSLSATTGVARLSWRRSRLRCPGGYDPLGLAAVTGSCGSVGMAGLSLRGRGNGPLIGRFGLALDN